MSEENDMQAEKLKHFCKLISMKHLHGVHDGEIKSLKSKSSVCLLLHTHAWDRRSRYTLHVQLVISVLLQ